MASDRKLDSEVNALSRQDSAIAAGIVFGFSVLYWFGRSLTYGPGDSPQHVFSAITWGISWPPSYPLYVFLGHLAAQLPGSAAGNVNWLSGLFHAGAYSLLYLTLRKCRVSVLPSCIAVISLGLSPLFWYYSENAEVRGLNDLLAAATAFFAVSWVADRRTRDLSGLAVAIGFGIGHHPTYVLILPAIAILLWGTIPPRLLPAVFGLATVSLASPYALLGLRLEFGQPAYNLTGAEHFLDVWDLFIRRSLGPPWRVAAGGGLFGPGGFDPASFVRHFHWFLQALSTHSAWIVFPLALVGVIACFRSDRRLLLFWLAWFFISAFVFIVLGSQQLHIHDQDFAYSVAVRFYLLPMIALYALMAHGTDAVQGRLRTPAHVVLMGLAIILPLASGWISLRGKDVVADYAREIVAETEPSDMIVIDTDSTFFALDYIDLVEHGLNDRVLLHPSLFSFPPYRMWLTRRYPTLGIPSPESMMDWTRWRALNPGRALYAEVEWKDSIRTLLPNSAPAGFMLRGCTADEQCVAPSLAADRLTHSAVAAFTRKDLYPFSLDIYILKHEREMMLWTLDALGTSEPAISQTLAQRVDNILR
ncbi:MAG TPA: DUF2723 domain-containing protein [Elusimicrobiota bacterium]|nr:DUF2723 domain-containing protein [Elusimicrobiota bacterium]